MPESTRISFRYRSIPQLSDFSELMEMLFPGNRNQQHAAACIFIELKWSHHIVPNMAYMESKYDISRRILQRTRAKLAKLGLIEHVSYLNSRYGGEQGWKLSSRFETALRALAAKCAQFRDVNTGSREKDMALVDFAASRRGLAGREQKSDQKGENGW